MKIQAIIVLSFIAFYAEARLIAKPSKSVPIYVPETISRYLRPEIDCLLDIELCNGNTEITRHALPNYLSGNTSSFLINQKIRISTIFRNIEAFYPSEWRTIKANYEKTLDTKQKTELDDALSKQILASYPNDELTREITNCFLYDRCNLIILILKIKMYEMAVFGRCPECSDSTMEWLWNIQSLMDKDYNMDFKRALVTKESSYHKSSQEKRVHECLQYPPQTAIDCVQSVLNPIV